MQLLFTHSHCMAQAGSIYDCRCYSITSVVSIVGKSTYLLNITKYTLDAHCTEAVIIVNQS